MKNKELSYISMDNHESIEDHLTNYNIFNEKDIECEMTEVYKKNKKYINLYNAALPEALHKFWFLLTKTKIIKVSIEDIYTTIYFVLNDNNMEHRKIMDYMNNIMKYTKSIIGDECTYTVPYFKKPLSKFSIIPITYLKDSIFVDNDDNVIHLSNDIDSNILYNVVFEIKYGYVVQHENTLNLNLSIIKLQKKNKYNVGSIDIVTSKPKYTKEHIHENIQKHVIKKHSDVKVNETRPGLIINDDILSSKITQLRKTINTNNVDKNKSTVNSELEKSFLEQKKLLKKAEPIKIVDCSIIEENDSIKVKKEKKKKKTKKEKKT
jgi:hypothetical protein